jgi:hypothetical protein
VITPAARPDAALSECRGMRGGGERGAGYAHRSAARRLHAPAGRHHPQVHLILAVQPLRFLGVSGLTYLLSHRGSATRIA